MGSPCSSQTPNCMPLRDLSGTLGRLDSAWKREARFRSILLSIILVICLLSGNGFALLSGHLPPAKADSANPGTQAGGFAGLTVLLLAFLRIWPEVRRCRPRIAELQNIANRIQYLADRRAIGIKVSAQEWRNVFEASQRILGATAHIQDDESLHPIVEILYRLLHLGNGRSESQTPTPSPTT